ncbi:MAG TPA: sodium:solute symporter [Ignavibacteriaceae bacterium]|nr:sodium:solute symporter [Ignavibacteriaceae bacterium]
MRTLDWIVLIGSLLLIVVYGIWKSRGSKDMKGYLLSNNDMKWHTIAFSIMATQASAITFLSTPGQAYVDGMRFVQFYLGLPIAMVILSITAVPLYHKLKVYTAYEYLETKFDLKTRALAAFLFLIQRGLAAGLTIYAPSIILSILLGWNIYLTNLAIGIVVIIYTATGGSKAVGWTQFQQMIIITLGMFAAFFMIMHLLPDNLSFMDSLKVTGKLGKLNAIDFSFDLDNRYSFWSGIIGGLFLQLSYFGTDQSQVQRYLTGESVKQSRLGLLFNGIVKIPMQFSILFIGAMLFLFYQFVAPPLFFNPVETNKIKNSIHAEEYNKIEDKFHQVFEEKKGKLEDLVKAIHTDNDSKADALQEDITRANNEIKDLKEQAVGVIAKNDPLSETNDTNYIFLTFVLNYLPAGLIGLVLAAILAASMSSTSSEINSLASTTIIDVYKRMIKKDGSEKHYLIVTKSATVFWGLLAILFAEFANQLGSLIEAVNILGSLFYGTILGIFLLAFYFKRIKATPTFLSAIIAEVVVILSFIFTDISFLWYNVIGCLLVILLAHILNNFDKGTNTQLKTSS